MFFGTYITDSVGNNQFSYEKRKQLGSECKLYIPEIKDIRQISKENSNKYLKIGKDIVFEEYIEDKLFSHKGLEKYLVAKYKNNKICIFDNHNVAFYFVGKYFLETGKSLNLIHIDQHSDMKNPLFIPTKLNNLKEIEEYTFTGLNVGNYLIPLQKIGFIDDIKQCRTEYSLLNLKIDEIKSSILNIDLDFWAEGMTSSNKSLEKVKEYIKISPLVLIATSPYFIDQKKALELIHKLFD